MEIGQQRITLHLVDQIDHLLQPLLVDVRHPVGVGILLIGLIESHLSGVSQGDVAVDATNLCLLLRQYCCGIEQILGDARQVLIAGELIVSHIDIFCLRQVLVHIGHFVEEANQLEVVVRTQHLHLGDTQVTIFDLVRISGVQDTQRGVTTGDEAVEVEPFPIDVAVVGLQLEGLHGVYIPYVTFSTAPFVGIVGTHLAVAPVRRGAHAGIALLVGHTIEGGVGRVDQEVDRLG